METQHLGVPLSPVQRSWREILGHHWQGRQDAQGMHSTVSHMSISNRILKISYFITQVPPAKEDVES